MASQYVDFIGTPFQMRVGDTVIPIETSMSFAPHIVTSTNAGSYGGITLERPYMRISTDDYGNPHLYFETQTGIAMIGVERYAINAFDRREWRIIGTRLINDEKPI